MALRHSIDKFLNKFLPYPPVAHVKLNKKQIDYMPSEVYKHKLVTDPGFKREAEIALSQVKVNNYGYVSDETQEMVIDPKTTIRGFGRG